MRLKSIDYSSVDNKYIIKIICEGTTFVIPIDKSIIAKHVYSLNMNNIEEDLGLSKVLVSQVYVCYDIDNYNRKILSVILTLSNWYGERYTIAEFDLKGSKLFPTISINNTLGE